MVLNWRQSTHRVAVVEAPLGVASDSFRTLLLAKALVVEFRRLYSIDRQIEP